MRKRTHSREMALQILYQFNITNEKIEDVMEDFWPENKSDEEVRIFAEKLALGTAGHVQDLDDVIVKYAENWNLKRMAIIDKNILRLAAYELLYLEDIPPKVTINEAVNLAKKFSQADSGKFVNGILDRISHTEKMPEGKEK